MSGMPLTGIGIAVATSSRSPGSTGSWPSCRPAGSILDIGCGSAQPIAGYLIGKGYDVTGVDTSPGLIGLCRSRFPQQNWLVADMRQLSLSWCYTGLLAWDSFFHLCPDDQRRMFPIFGRHAAPGAALMFISGPSE
jgi:SAM-dependent methyltransferase